MCNYYVKFKKDSELIEQVAFVGNCVPRVGDEIYYDCRHWEVTAVTHEPMKKRHEDDWSDHTMLTYVTAAR